jgi:prepilin-type N-terminal cleavage/methylation domain-containing protein
MRSLGRGGVRCCRCGFTLVELLVVIAITGIQEDKDGLSGAVAPGGIKEEWIVPKKHADPKTCGLTVTVERGMAPVKLDLTGSSGKK